MEMDFKKRPRCRECPFFILGEQGIPDTCEDTNKETWEQNPNQDFFLCNPMQEWFDDTATKLERRLKEIMAPPKLHKRKGRLMSYRRLIKKLLEAISS